MRSHFRRKRVPRLNLDEQRADLKDGPDAVPMAPIRMIPGNRDGDWELKFVHVVANVLTEDSEKGCHQMPGEQGYKGCQMSEGEQGRQN